MYSKGMYKLFKNIHKCWIPYLLAILLLAFPVREVQAQKVQREFVIAEQKSQVEQERKRYTGLAAQSKEQQKRIVLQQKTVLSEKARIASLSAQTEKQQRLIEEQDKAITKEKLKLDKVVVKNREQSKVITSERKQIEKEQTRYSNLARESDAQQKLLDRQKLLADQERTKYEQLTKNVQEREISLKEQAKKIAARTAILNLQDEKIEAQQETIDKQETTLAMQSETINSQRNFLYTLGIIVLLLCGMAYAIYRGYRNKKLANALLFEQKQLIQNSANQLAEANEKLKDLDKLKALFIASMSHELRTPLNSIIGFTGIMLQGMVGKLEEQQKDFLERVYKASKHLLALISDVIDISKIECGTVHAYPETFNLKSVVVEAATYLQKIKEKEIELKVNVPSDIEIFNDQKRLFQCILNLLSNAFRYTEKGEIKVSAKSMGDQIEIMVEDTGIGISEAGLKNLFLPFERLNSPLRIKESGVGLGLYLTKKITQEILEGSLEVESQLGIGSKFKLKFPIQLSNKEFDEIAPSLEGVK
jgi:signal transduction histidine kinase